MISTAQQADQIISYILGELERKAPTKTVMARQIIMGIQNNFRLDAEVSLNRAIQWQPKKPNGNVRAGIIMLAMGIVIYAALYALMG